MKYPTATEVQNTEVQQLIRDYHGIMHSTIGTTVVIDPYDENISVNGNEMRDPKKSDDGAYYGF